MYLYFEDRNVTEHSLNFRLLYEHAKNDFSSQAILAEFQKHALSTYLISSQLDLQLFQRNVNSLSSPDGIKFANLH